MLTLVISAKVSIVVPTYTKLISGINLTFNQIEEKNKCLSWVMALSLDECQNHSKVIIALL